MPPVMVHFVLLENYTTPIKIKMGILFLTLIIGILVVSGDTAAKCSVHLVSIRDHPFLHQHQGYCIQEHCCHANKNGGFAILVLCSIRCYVPH